jgi:hypothetical protein
MYGQPKKFRISRGFVHMFLPGFSHEVLMVSSTLVLICVILATSAAVRADTWMVYPDGSGEAPTIAAAIDSCVSGDIIIVGSGTYFEGNLIVDGKDIRISGDGYPVISSPTPGSGTGMTIRNCSSAFFLFNINFEYFDTGIAIEESPPAIWITVIKHCTTAVDVTGTSSYPEIAYSLVDSCTTAIRFQEGSVSNHSIVTNNTIVNCNTGIAASAVVVDVELCIVYGCTAGSSDIHGDPLFCMSHPSAPNPYYLDVNSPCWKANNACGQNVGAYTQMDCEGSATESSSWGTIKSLFR